MIETLYRWLLRLYPPDFRQHFAEEMLTVFTRCLQDARQDRRLTRFYLREISDTLRSIMRENLSRIVKREPESPERITIARRILQITTVLLFMVYLWTATAGVSSVNLIVFPVFNAGILAGFIITLRRERLGGGLMIGFSLLWCGVITAGAAQLIPLGAAFAGALVYTLPFMLIGWLYIRIDKETALSAA
jgi:hypothetical protein